jgi:hypothetical protein
MLGFNHLLQQTKQKKTENKIKMLQEQHIAYEAIKI